MNKKWSFLVVALVAISFAASCTFADPPVPATGAPQVDAAHPEAAHWLRCELYFGIGIFGASDDGIAEMRWLAFMDREVTPRFPDGLTVLDAYGQWRGHPNEQPSRLRSKVLIILCEDTRGNRESIDAIRTAFKAATHDKSVLLAMQHVDVSF
jgi:hypothetical protein